MQARSFFILAVAVLLASCATPQPRPPAPAADPLAAADELEAEGRDGAAAALLAEAAERRSGDAAARLRIRSARLWLAANDQEAARAQLAHVEIDSLTGADAVDGGIVYAAVALASGRPADALSKLPDTRGLANTTAAEVLRLRAEAARALGDHRSAVADLVRRERLLPPGMAIADNREAIWQALRQVSGAPEEDGTVLSGWLALAQLRQLAWQNPAQFERSLQLWRDQYRGHPAAEIYLPRVIEEQRRVATGVSEIAVILPFTGRFAAAAAAVRDGLLAAHYSAAVGGSTPRIRFYDNGGDPERAVDRYREAVQDGADFVIGPLQREAVTALARLYDLPVPVLALNTTDAVDIPGNLFQFGLLPEDEATQIAERVTQEGLMRGLVLVPDNDLGLRMLVAFRERLEALEGSLVAIETYDPAQQDHSTPIVRTLSIDESRARAQTLRNVLGLNLQSEPRRREDLDFVFLVATPQQGRLLRPQLRFHHASGLPVYASSHVYTGTIDAARDADMNGIAFTDMPWTIAPDASSGAAQAALRTHVGPAVERNTRLYALGFDAYRLAPVLRHDPTLLTEPVPAATGALRVATDGRVHRTLSWARFRNGVPRPLQSPLVAPEDDGD